MYAKSAVLDPDKHKLTITIVGEDGEDAKLKKLAGETGGKFNATEHAVVYNVNDAEDKSHALQIELLALKGYRIDWSRAF